MNKKSNNTSTRRTFKFEYWRNFKYFRVNAELTQKQAAKELGVLESMICNYENAKCEPPISIIVKMAEVYRTDLYSLLMRDEFGKFYTIYADEAKLHKNKIKTKEELYKDLDASMVEFVSLLVKDANVGQPNFNSKKRKK